MGNIINIGPELPNNRFNESQTQKIQLDLILRYYRSMTQLEFIQKCKNRLPKKYYYWKGFHIYIILLKARISERYNIIKAMRMYDSAFRHATILYGDLHPLAGLIYQSLAYLYYLTKSYPEALIQLEKALLIEINSFGQNTQDVKIIRDNIEYIKGINGVSSI